MLTHLTVERIHDFIRQAGISDLKAQLRETIDSLTSDEQAELLGLMYFGRRDSRSSSQKHLSLARNQIPFEGLGVYMTSKPLAKYLTDGLARLVTEQRN